MAGLAGGLVSGALVGFLEAASVWASEPAAGAWTPLYGTIFYALLLAPAGLGIGLLVGLAAKFLKKTAWKAHMAWTLAIIGSLLPVGLVVARFRIIRDIFHEKLAIASAAGIGVHLGLVIGAAVVGGLVWWLHREEGPLGKKSIPAMAGILFGGLIVASLPFTLSGGAEEEAIDASDRKAQGPPVILIMVDTLRADHLTSYGYKTDTSPNLSVFSDDAVQFERAFAQASWTRPSTASLLTSLPPSAHKTMYKPDRLPSDVVTAAEAFQDQGYITGGMVTNYNIAPYFNFDQGFDQFKYLTPDYYFFAHEGASKLSLYNLARVIREKVAPSNDNPAHYYQDAEVTTDAALGWIERNKDKPFFFFLTYMDPHDPYFARPLDGEAYSRAAQTNPDPKMAKRFIELYDGEITYWDEHFGRMMKRLKDMGLYDKSMIIVTSDHGEEFQEHGGGWHGTTLYEEQIQVPLLVKMPGNASGGTGRDDLAALIDVPPTMTGAAKLKTPKTWAGRDLFGKVDAPGAVFSEEDHQGNVLRSLRGDQWKIIEANEGNPRGLAPTEVFDLSADPGEQKNVAADDKARTDKLKDSLQKASTGALENAVERDQHELDESSRERLKSLGYIEDDDDPKKKEAPKKEDAPKKEAPANP